MILQFKRISTVGERIFSFLIDHIVFTILFMIGGFSVLMFTVERNYLFWAILILLGMLFIYISKDIMNGRSLGKRIFCIGVRCIENPNELPDQWRLILRNVTLIIWPIEFLVMIFNSNGTRLGDMLAKTIVVKLEKKEDAYNEALEEYQAKYVKSKGENKKKVLRIIALSIVTLITIMVIFIGGVSVIMKNNDAYKTAITQIENSKEIISETGGVNGYGLMPMGSLSISNGFGEAEFVIKVKGEQRDTKVFTKLYKQPNSEWQIVRFYIIN